MELVPVRTEIELDAFYQIENIVYADYPQFRSSYADIMHNMVEGKSSFCKHATVLPYLITKSGQVIGRFTFIHDQNLSNYVQVAFFEALPEIEDLAEEIKSTAGKLFSCCHYLVAGLNGHLNYGAGFLLNRFDETPIIELPFTPSYYPDYFRSFKEKRISTFHFNMEEFYSWGRRERKVAKPTGINVRIADSNELLRESKIYAELNNACFSQHLYWSDRTSEEDYEQFLSLGPFFRGEYLLFAEFNGQPVGYLFWLPDLNEILGKDELPGPKQLQIIQNGYKFNTYRYSEIAVLPKFRGFVTLALFLEMLVHVEKLGCIYGEGGIIFEENQASLAMFNRYYKRIYSCETEPYRNLAVYECEL